MDTALIIKKIQDWCEERNGYIRIPFILFFIYIGIKYLEDPGYYGILGPLNLGVHEFGHLIFSFFGLTWNILGGTIVQLLAPFYGMVNFYKQEDYFSVALCFGWLASNLYYVAHYCADASSMSLPLVSPFGGHVYHDWNYLLSRMGFLSFDKQIASGISFFGFVSMAICIFWGSLFIYWMIYKPNKRS